MNFSKYAPVVNAYLNPKLAERNLKMWGDVVDFFFRMNVDPNVSSYTELASTFEQAKFPNYFRIEAAFLNGLFGELNVDMLTSIHLIQNEHFIDDNGLRLSFDAVRRLALQKKDTAAAFEFINNIYQIYLRYELSMINRSLKKTHWTVIEQVHSFSKSMRPHESTSESSENSFCSMDTQPRVFCIMKGTLKSLSNYLLRNQKNVNPKYSKTQIVPIYESVLIDVDREIWHVMNYIDVTYLQPYRMSQIGSKDKDGNEIKKLTRTKQHIRLLKSTIMIDPNQSDFTPCMIMGVINSVRLQLKNGQMIWFPPQLTKNEKDEIQNSTDINMFDINKCMYIDVLKKISLTPYANDICSVDGSAIIEPIPVFTKSGRASNAEELDGDFTLTRSASKSSVISSFSTISTVYDSDGEVEECKSSRCSRSSSIETIGTIHTFTDNDIRSDGGRSRSLTISSMASSTDADGKEEGSAPSTPVNVRKNNNFVPSAPRKIVSRLQRCNSFYSADYDSKDSTFDIKCVKGRERSHSMSATAHSRRVRFGDFPEEGYSSSEQ